MVKRVDEDLVEDLEQRGHVLNGLARQLAALRERERHKKVESDDHDIVSVNVPARRERD